MKILVCGGRDFGAKFIMFPALDKLHAQTPITCLVEGGAKGADAAAKEWARANNIPVVTVKADWNKHGKGAGPIRNQKMLDSHPDIELVVTFSTGGPGTRDMATRAEKKLGASKVIDGARWLLENS